MLYSHDGEGLHRSGRRRRRSRLHVRDVVPRRRARGSSRASTSPTSRRRTASRSRPRQSGSCSATAPRRRSPPAVGSWPRPSRCRRTSSPLVAGPYHQITDSHDGIALSVVSRQSLKEALDREAADIFEVTKQSFDEFHRMFGYRYPFGEYHQAFVPEFNAGAMENPGCVTFRDQMVFRSAVTDGERSQPGPDDRARDGAPVVRRHRDDEVVERPLAERVVRRVHGAPGVDRRDPVHRQLDRLRLHAQVVGPAGRPAVLDAPDRCRRRQGRARVARRLRRHLVREGRRGPQAARGVPR